MTQSEINEFREKLSQTITVRFWVPAAYTPEMRRVYEMWVEVFKEDVQRDFYGHNRRWTEEEMQSFDHAVRDAFRPWTKKVNCRGHCGNYSNWNLRYQHLSVHIEISSDDDMKFRINFGRNVCFSGKTKEEIALILKAQANLLLPKK